MSNKNILVMEPGYKNKYPPLGLMKIAQYHGKYGKKDNVLFVKGEDKSALGKTWDRVYVTTLFSFEWDRTCKAIDFALELVRGRADLVFVGGIAASLMHERFVAEPRWRGIRFIKGLLTEAPATSLKLDEFEEELYADDIFGGPIEELVPDYSILDQIAYKYPVRDAYFMYASRGCIRTCTFCGVPKLEGRQRDTPSITRLVHEIEKLYGTKKDLIFMDNNIVASDRFSEIVAEIVDLGFGRGAMLKRGNIHIKRRVDFNQGVDARELAAKPQLMKEIAKTCVSPLRIAFDHLGLRKQYEKSIRLAAENGLTSLSNYMLYNYNDDPHDLYERMHLNVVLNEDLDIRIFSFPMRYQPVDRIDRGFVGQKWQRYQLRSMQIILKATHGIVSGSPKFFRKAFGTTAEEFTELLLRPHHFIFNRLWYEEGDGVPEFEEFQSSFRRLSTTEKGTLVEKLSKVIYGDNGRVGASRGEIAAAFDAESNPRLREVLEFYVPPAKNVEREIWDKQKALKDQRIEAKTDFNVPEDELVEDAGLDDESMEEEIHRTSTAV